MFFVLVCRSPNDGRKAAFHEYGINTFKSISDVCRMWAKQLMTNSANISIPIGVSVSRVWPSGNNSRGESV